MSTAPSLDSAGPVAFVLKGYPRLSETFIAQEIAGLEALGLDIRLVSLRHPTDAHLHPIHANIRAPVSYLPEYLHDEPARVLKAWRRSHVLPGYRRAFSCWIRDLKRDPTRNRIRRYGQAVVLAAELPAEVRQIHAHFLHTPASVARYAAMMRDLPWSFSAHAKDIWTSPDWEKVEKIADCRWGVTCTTYGLDHLRGLSPGNVRKLHLHYHGLNLKRFPSNDVASATNQVFIILTVGRAVEKKGLDTILLALGRLPDNRPWTFIHLGGGPLLQMLKEQAADLNIEDKTDWRGALPQTEVLSALRQADLFVLASRIGGDGDRDGLPNVLMEAASQGLPIVATRVAALPEFIENGQSGTLVEPDDPAALAMAIHEAMENPAAAKSRADVAKARLEAEFSFEKTIGGLAKLFAAPSGNGFAGDG